MRKILISSAILGSALFLTPFAGSAAAAVDPATPTSASVQTKLHPVEDSENQQDARKEYRRGFRQGFADGYSDAKDDCFLSQHTARMISSGAWQEGYADGYERGYERAFDRFCG